MDMEKIYLVWSIAQYIFGGVSERATLCLLETILSYSWFVLQKRKEEF